MFCYDIVTNKINCPSILSQINLHCPNRRIRNNEFFRPERHTTNYGMMEPINVFQRDFNEVSFLFDFNISRNNFKERVIQFLKCN